MSSTMHGPSLPFEEAAEWFLKVRSMEPSAADLAQWNDWLRTQENQRAFDAVTRAWQSAEGLADAPWPTPAELAADVDEGARPVATQRWWTQPRTMAAVLALLCIGLGVGLRESLFAPDATKSIAVHETAAAQHREIELADGSKVFLGGRTTLSVSYAPDRRTVMLDRGEALFEVTKDPRRPFMVVAGSGTITAVGTAFNVRRDERRVVVSVTEGKVSITQQPSGAVTKPAVSAKTALLGRGEELAYGVGGEPGAVHRADIEAVTAWRSGRLRYHNERLEHVVQDLNRYSRKQILFGDSGARNLLFSGTVRQDEIEDWLRGLSDIFPLQVVQTDDDHVLLRAQEIP